MQTFRQQIEARRTEYVRTMTKARILRLFIGTKLAARVFGLRAHNVRSARECGWSKI